jgi:hypothetical protein
MGRNWEWSLQQGKEKRLAAEKACHQLGMAVPTSPPLHSHDATMQAKFNRGWRSVTTSEIQMHLGLVDIPKSQDPLAKIKELRSCLF